MAVDLRYSSRQAVGAQGGSYQKLGSVEPTTCSSQHHSFVKDTDTPFLLGRDLVLAGSARGTDQGVWLLSVKWTEHIKKQAIGNQTESMVVEPTVFTALGRKGPDGS